MLFAGPFFGEDPQFDRQCLQILDIFSIIAKQNLQRFGIPIPGILLPQSHRHEAVDAFGVAVDAEDLLDPFESSVKVIAPAIVHQVLMFEMVREINSDFRVDDRQIEPAPVVGEKRFHPFQEIKKPAFGDIGGDQLPGPLYRPVDADHGNAAHPARFDIQKRQFGTDGLCIHR